MRSYLDKIVSDASKTGHATPDVKWMNVQTTLRERPALWDLAVALARSPEIQQRAAAMLEQETKGAA
jgi:hypothetical protein